MLRIQSLTKLDVYGNMLKSIPEDISTLPKLSSLVVGWNHIEVIPKSLIRMKQLTELDLWGGSSLPCLPTYIGEIVTLTCIDLHANELT